MQGSMDAQVIQLNGLKLIIISVVLLRRRRDGSQSDCFGVVRMLKLRVPTVAFTLSLGHAEAQNRIHLIN